MTPPHSEKIMSKLKTLICPHCGNKTPHSVVFTHSYIGGWYGADGKETSNPPTSYYTGYACSTCNDLSIYENHDYQDWDEESILAFPESASMDESIPQSIKEIYEEAKRIQKISPNAYAVLIRRALEALCDDREAPKGKLHVRLQKLVDNGEIPPVLAEVTTALRELGNSGAHNTEQKVTVPITWQMENLFKTVVEYVYVAPARLKSYQESIRPNGTPNSESGSGSHY